MKTVFRVILTIVIAMTAILAATCCQPETIRVDMLLEEETIASLTEKAETVVIGVVEEQLPSQQSQDKITGETVFYTDWVLAVEETIKIPLASDRIIIRTLGGTVDQTTMIVDASPSFVVGEKVVLFLSKQAGGYFDLPENHYTVQGWIQGKYTISGANAISAASSRSEPLGTLVEEINATRE
jgi:hypothetical protein